MGSTQSNLPAMEDTEDNRRNRDSEMSRRQQQHQQQQQRRRSHHRHQREVVETSHEASGDDPWWWEIENENLLLDRVPNVTAEPSANAVVVPLSDDFNTLLKIGQDVSLTLNNGNNNNNDNNNTANNNSENNNNSLEEIDSESVARSSTGYSTNSTAAAAAATASKWSQPSQSLDEFREELRQKRMARQTAVQDLRSEMATLRRQLAAERDVTRRLRNGEEVDEDVEEVEEQNEVTALEEKPGAETTPAVADGDIDEDDENACSRGRHANIELANAQLALQLANSENISLRSELGVVQKQVGTLKEVVACCKQMLAMKEEQCVQLKTKLSDIEESFGEREMKIMSDNLRQEYERQLTNIRQLRQLYEERQRIAAAEHENLQRLISIKKDELTAEQERTKTFEERNQALLKEVEAANNELAALREECNEHKFEKKALKEEMGAVNTLFSQMVMGFNGKNNLDIDRLATMLEENRTLLNDMATKEANCSDGATLPKLLFELVEQAAIGAGGSRSGSCSPGPEGSSDEDENKNEGDEERAEGVVRGERDCDEVDDANNKESTVTSNNNNNNNSGNADDCEVESADGVATDVGEATTEEAQERRRRLLRQREEEGEEAAEDNGINNCSNGSISNIVTATTNNTNNNNNVNGNGNKKHHHHRKSAANKTKMSTSSTGVSEGASPSTSRSLPSTSSSSLSSSSAATFRLHEPEVIGKVASTQEIIGNLPKVWKVLMELLSHHKIEQVQFEENGASEDCYKSVETPNGPKAELSVSKTYIKLKDLILEKKSLVKETNRLKTLNSHLDYRLNEQEKRLSAVSLELTKTWHLVGKMQRQHRQLHTQEQILRYQLQQKRRLLSELKDELEYCRRKWAAARAKNDESQEQCNDLRREFAKRKLEDANSNSAESGYSDSGPASDEEERTTSSGATAASTSMASTATSSLMATTASSLVASSSSSMPSASSSKATPSSSKASASSSKASASVASSTPSGRSKGELRGRFEHSRKIKRMQSMSPGRAAAAKAGEGGEILLRWNSAPPTCGWRAEDDDDGESDDDDNEDNEEDLPGTSSKGAVPKRTSRSKQRGRGEPGDNVIEDDQEEAAAVAPPTGDRAVRIQRLEEQCKSLIQQVLETSDNRERLEVQLCRFQDEIAPVQYAIPLDQFISKKRLERMTRASSAPASGALTPREEEYTRKRSERLGRLEEESRQLISRIKRTSDRGHYLRCSLERLHRGGRAASASLGGVGASGISREGSFESNTEDEEPEGGVERVEASGQVKASVQVKEEVGQKKDGGRNHEDDPKCEGLMEDHLLSKDPLEPTENQSQRNPLTPAEEAYTARRAERLRRLEEEGRQLLTRLSRNTQRGSTLETRLDTLHERHVGQSQEDDMSSPPPSSSSTTSSKSSSSTSSSSTTSPTSPTIEKRIANIERISSNRDERLRILEEEGKQLISRLSSTSERGTRMINRIAEREQNRLARQSETPAKESETSMKESETKESETKESETKESETKESETKTKDPTTTSITSTTTSTSTSTTSGPSSTLTTSTPSSSSSSESNNLTPSTSSTPSTTLSAAPSKTSTDATPPPSIDATPIELDSSDAAVAGALLPTMKNVACSSIVCEELAECVTVTTTPSRIARPTQGAVSKTQSKPVAQLSAAKVKPKKSTVTTKSEDSESLEEMVKRLKSLPFPEEANTTEAEVATTSKGVETSSMEDSALKDSAETSEDSKSNNE